MFLMKVGDASGTGADIMAGSSTRDENALRLYASCHENDIDCSRELARTYGTATIGKCRDKPKKY